MKPARRIHLLPQRPPAGLGWRALAAAALACFVFAAGASALDLSREPLRPLPAPHVDPDRARLGEKLFSDPRLSADGTVSCAHCHDLAEHGGADGLRHSFGVEGRETLINTPTVFNAALNVAQFWDGRAATLEEQINGPVTGHAEMAATWPGVVARLKRDAALAREFRRLYPDGVTPANIRDAIAEFERSLITVNSRFDRYLKGDESALTAREKHGYALFKSYGCVACHQGRNVGGNLFQKLGIVRDYFADHPPENAADAGRYNVTHRKADLHRFKVPSLRLAVLTPPYLHNGSQKTLAGVIRNVMAKYQLGRCIPDDDLRDIIAFLYTLPGEYRGRSLEPRDRRWLDFPRSRGACAPAGSRP